MYCMCVVCSVLSCVCVSCVVWHVCVMCVMLCVSVVWRQLNYKCTTQSCLFNPPPPTPHHPTSHLSSPSTDTQTPTPTHPTLSVLKALTCPDGQGTCHVT